jgi:hypothetical protein
MTVNNKMVGKMNIKASEIVELRRMGMNHVEVVDFFINKFTLSNEPEVRKQIAIIIIKIIKIAKQQKRMVQINFNF